MYKYVALPLMVAVAACQTVPRQTASFSPRQVTALVDAGFKPAGENYELGISDRLLFAVNQADIDPANSQVITRLSKIFLSVGIHGTTVQGHTDSSGSSQYNLDLSNRRAQSVKALLVKAGLSAAETRTAGMGEQQPIADNATPEGRAENRRVVIVVSPSDAAPVR